MKTIFAVIALVILSMSFASSAESPSSLSRCKYFSILKSDGWIIHKPRNFRAIARERLDYLERGLDEANIVHDTSGVFVNRQGLNGARLQLKVNMWDDLRSPQSEMYGDIAIMRNAFAQEEVSEIRWYENGEKHLVINPKVVQCMVETSPYAINSIL